ncbi:Uncharacterised protein [Priestia megaterium]|uniref:HNH endonuclease signature motif containing protein n=1 Tax=Priestia megaterium TaxID=1404 RepID=UPI000E1AC5CC|nr:HNH endonuclease [Priestia megaterium]SUV06416.1 Uncharacterised protein [Priestia megaterium]
MAGGRIWTAEEDAFIKENHSNMGYRDLSFKLNKSYNAVKHRLWYLGLKIANKYNRNLSYSAYGWKDWELEKIMKYGGKLPDREIHDSYLPHIPIEWIRKKRHGLKIPTRSIYKEHSETIKWNGNVYSYKESEGFFRAHNGKRKYLHREVMEKELGRELRGEEVVHHINGDKRDNKISNLFLCINQQHHTEIHKNIQLLGYELYKIGVIGFDVEKREYLCLDNGFHQERIEFLAVHQDLNGVVPPITFIEEDRASLKRKATEWISDYLSKEAQSYLSISRKGKLNIEPCSKKELDFISQNANKMLPAVIGMFLNRSTAEIEKIMRENDISELKLDFQYKYTVEDIQYIVEQVEINRRKTPSPRGKGSLEKERRLNGQELVDKIYKDRFHKYIRASSTLLTHIYQRGLNFDNGKTYNGVIWTKAQLLFIRDNNHLLHFPQMAQHPLFKGIDPNWIGKVRRDMGLKGKATFTNNVDPLIYKGKKYYFHNHFQRRENKKVIVLHRVVAEDKLKRELESGEGVHHLDGDKINNHPNNLFIFKNQSEHMSVHRQLERVVLEYLKESKVDFCFEAQTYYLLDG